MATWKRYAAASIFLLGAAAVSASAGVFSATNYASLAMNDTNVGISTNNQYVIAANIIGANVTINGIEFAGTTNAVVGPNWALVGAGSPYTSPPGNKGNVSGQLTNLFNQFQYNGNPATLILSNLVAGQAYAVTFYSQTFGGPRTQSIAASGGGSVLFDQDPGGGSLLRYSFVATNATESLSFTVANTANATFHFYGFSERQIFNNQWNPPGDGSFNDPANWTRLDAGTPFGVPDGAGLSAFLPSNDAPATVLLDANTTLGHLGGESTNAFTLTSTNGATLTFDAGPGGVSCFYARGGLKTITTPADLTCSLVKFGDGQLLLDAPLSGAGGLNVQQGLLSLNGTNSYAGATTVAGGTLDLRHSEALPAATALGVTTPATIVLSNGVSATAAVFSVNAVLQKPGTWGASGSGAAYTNDGIFSGAGVITVLGGLVTTGGSWGVNAGGNWGAPTNWAGGIVAQGTNATAFFTNAITADRVVTNPYAPLEIGYLTFGSPSFNWIVTNGEIRLAVSSGTPAIAVRTNRATIASPLSGTSGLLKTGAGTLVLGADASLSGGLTIQNGALQFGVGGAAGWVGGDVANDGRLIFARSDTNVFGGAISGTGSVFQSGAGMTLLTNANTYSGGTILTAGRLGISQHANLGGAATPLSISGAVLQITGTAIQNLDARPVNWSTFNGGFDIVDAANTFTITGVIGNVSSAGSFTKYGAGALVFTNARASQQIVLFRGGSNLIESGCVVTALQYVSVGQSAPDRAALAVRGNGRLVALNDFNVGDVAGATGILTVADAAEVAGRTLYVGKSGTAVGVLRLDAGTITSIGNGDWRFGGGTGTNDIRAYAYVRQTGGGLTHTYNFQVGAYGLAQWDLLGGALTNGGGAPIIARFPGSRGTMNLLGGSWVSTGWGTIVGEQGHGVLNVRAGTVNFAGAPNGFTIGGWQGNGDQGTGVVSLAGGMITAPIVRKGATNASVAIFHFDGGVLRASANQGSFLQGLDLAAIWPGGASFDAQAFNITVAQPLLAPAGNGVASLTLTNGGAGYLGPPLVTISGGGGTGAVAYAEIDTALGVVTNIVVTSPGVNYSSTPVILLQGGGGAGAGVGAVTLAANATGGGLTKAGVGTLTLTATNTYGGNTVIQQGTILLSNTNALGAGTVTLVTNTAGIGPAYALDQGFIEWLTSRLDGATSAGVLALGAGSSNAVDLGMLPGWQLGAGGGTHVFAGTLLNAGTNLYLGGGNGTLVYVPTIGTGTNVFVGIPGQASAGAVVLAGTNDPYTSAIAVLGGTLAAGRTNAFGGAGASVFVTNGASLDVAGQVLGAVPVRVAGAGANTNGAIVNSGAQQVNALQNVRLDGDATFGGANRWDLRGGVPFLDLAGHTLTKTGANYISVFGGNISDGNIVIGQGTLDLGGGTTVTGGAGRITVGPAGALDFFAPPSPVVLRPITVNGGTITCGGGTPVIGAPITLAGATNAINTQGFNLVLTGLVDGAGALLKSGLGTLVLPTPVAFTGATIVTGGALELAAADPLAGTLGASAGLLVSGGSVIMDLTAGLFGTNARPVTLGPGGTLTSSNGAWSRLDGPLTLSGGTLAGGTPDAVNGNWVLLTNIVIGTNSSITAQRTQLGVSGGSTFDVRAGATLVAAGTFEDPGLGAGGTGSLIKAGAGTMTLTTTNSYSGATAVRGGTLALGGTGGPAGAVARYALDGSADDSSGNGLNGSVIGAGSSYGPGRFGQALNVTGSQYVQVAYSPLLALNNFTVSAWINYSVTPGTYGIVGTRFGGDFTFDMKYQSGKIHSDIGNGTGWLTTTADANVTVPSNGWHMITYVVTNNGCQIYLDAAPVASIAYSGTPLFMKTNQTMGIASDYPGEFLNGGVDDVNIYGRALTPAEIVVLHSAYASGMTNVLPAATPLLLAGGATLDLAGVQQSVGALDDLDGGGGSITNRAPQSASLAIVGEGTAAFSGVIADGTASVALVKAGGGLQILHGASTYSGGTTISNGTLLVNGAIGRGLVTVAAGGTLGGTGTVQGAVSNDGLVAPGASLAGILTVARNYTNGSGTLAIELAGLDPGSGHDRLAVWDVAYLGGELRVTTNGFTPVVGQTFTVLTASAISGTFATTNLPALAGGATWEVTYAPDGVVLTVMALVLTPYQQWALAITNEALRGDQEDADGDGYANLLEYSQGTDPTNEADRARVLLVKTGEVYALKFNYVTSAVDLVYHVEASYALTNNTGWEGIKSNYLGEGWTGDTTVTWTNAGPVIQIFAEDNDPFTGRRGMRLRVERP